MKKVIHSSDWHLGAKLGDRERLPEQVEFLNWFRGLLRREKPDLLVVTGDIFDTYVPSNEAEKVYCNFLAEAWRDGCVRNILITGGNHDSPSVLEKARTVLGCLNVVVVPAPLRGENGEVDYRSEALEFECADGGKIGVAAIPFLRSSDLSNAARDGGVKDDVEGIERQRAGYAYHVRKVVEAVRERGAGGPMLITGHCTMQGASLSDREADERHCTIGMLDDIGVDVLPEADYVALGHLHIAQGVGGKETIRYAGSPIAMSFSESESEKSVSIVTIRETDDKTNWLTEVRSEAIPQGQILKRFRGTPEAIIQKLKEYRDANYGSTAWIEITIQSGEGDRAELRKEVDALLSGTQIVRHAMIDKRSMEKAGEALLEIRAEELHSEEYSPEKMAEIRLRELGERFTDEQIESYMELIREALASEDAVLSEKEGEVK